MIFQDNENLIKHHRKNKIQLRKIKETFNVEIYEFNNLKTNIKLKK